MFPRVDLELQLQQLYYSFCSTGREGGPCEGTWHSIKGRVTGSHLISSSLLSVEMFLADLLFSPAVLAAYALSDSNNVEIEFGWKMALVTSLPAMAAAHGKATFSTPFPLV